MNIFIGYEGNLFNLFINIVIKFKTKIITTLRWIMPR